MTSTPGGALYVCYFGVREPLVHAQVLPYLRALAGAGWRISLLTFEPDLDARWTRDAIAEYRERLGRDGIDWHLLRYHRRPTRLARLFDVVAGGWRAARIAKERQLSIFHGRSHVGTAIATLARRLAGGWVVFDFRGFLIEEYVEADRLKPAGVLTRAVRWVERRLLRSADGLVVLTERARQTLTADGRIELNGPPVEVIPCCVEPNRFAEHAGDRDRVRQELGLHERLVCVFAGSLGGAYDWPLTAR